ncbi:hypothetical protein GETHOR_28600 [Geothrix oryzae]|uniref:Pyridoxamine 5'-phosphate oxidase putative domain-containing protein n=1 Tax=Geothrix oryzae TaxID=2927975 RepID=A0ABN6V4P7_9BACT|nr:pyridoxamine 5'-phosphate oxidase family protein [Geothrix oryzae]BDU70759.1 hypothetical protein GETHOR_28600 [Geothrix oryzae]
MSPDASFHLDPELVRFMTSGISMNAGSGSADGTPSQCRVLGCRVDPGTDLVTVFFAEPQAVDLLRDVARSGKLAVVFSDPPTHRTVQVKGSDARRVPLAEGDLARVAAYRTAFVQCLLPLGFTEPMVRTFLDCPDAGLVALTFTPEAAFNQTPGAPAGSPWAPGA